MIGAWVCSFLVVVLVVVAMKFQGRVWTCDCETPWVVWKGDVWSSHCSQHPLDPYSFTHFSHGLIFAVALGWAADRLDRWRGRRGIRAASESGVTSFPVHWQFFGAVFIASVWEVAENSAWVINRYRTVTMSLEYLGDSVVNGVADVACCAVGFWASRGMGARASMLLLVVIEAGLLLTTRDNLTLNVLMLLSPVESIKQWQASGR